MESEALQLAESCRISIWESHSPTKGLPMRSRVGQISVGGRLQDFSITWCKTGSFMFDAILEVVLHSLNTRTAPEKFERLQCRSLELRCGLDPVSLELWIMLLNMLLTHSPAYYVLALGITVVVMYGLLPSPRQVGENPQDTKSFDGLDVRHSCQSLVAY